MHELLTAHPRSGKMVMPPLRTLVSLEPSERPSSHTQKSVSRPKCNKSGCEGYSIVMITAIFPPAPLTITSIAASYTMYRGTSAEDRL